MPEASDLVPLPDPGEELARLRRALETDAETAVVIETSGSTGTPKRVPLSAANLRASAAASADWLGGQGQWLLCLPTRYIAGENVLVRSIVAGTEPVIMPEGHFDPAVFREAAARLESEARFVSLVPVQLQRLLDAAEADPALLSALRSFGAILVGGQATPPHLLEAAAAHSVRVVRTYGSSETAGGCVYDGWPIGATRLRIADGEVQVTGPTLTRGYLDDPDRTARAFAIDPDGTRWYRTGDLGAIAPDGRLSITGRADSVIISGGEKVLLEAVEAHVRSLSGLADAVVVAAEHPEWGQVPVVVTTATDASLADIRSSAAAALGRAAAPDRIVTLPAIPLLPSGKPDRVALAELAQNPSH